MNTSEDELPPVDRGWKQRLPVALLVLAAFVAGLALAWQGKTIIELRGEADALRNGFRMPGGIASENTVAPMSIMDQAEREKAELIKLRHQVRELNERIVEAHARPANFSNLLSGVMPAARKTSAVQLRPEWTRFEALATNQYAQAISNLNTSSSEYERFLRLNPAAKMSFGMGRTADALTYVSTLTVLNEKFSGGAPEKLRGDFIHTSNIILGRIALEEDRLEDAKRHLLIAGKVNSQTQFAPNMCLAKELLEKGEQQVVLQFFELCRKFWPDNYGKLDEWTRDVEAGRIPDFGANLLY